MFVMFGQFSQNFRELAGAFADNHHLAKHGREEVVGLVKSFFDRIALVDSATDAPHVISQRRPRPAIGFALPHFAQIDPGV